MSDPKHTLNPMALAFEPGQAINTASAGQEPRESQRSVPAGDAISASSQDTGALIPSASTTPVEEAEAGLEYARGPTPQWIQFLVKTGGREAQLRPSTALLRDDKAGVKFTIIDRPVAAKLRFLTDVGQKSNPTCLDFNLHVPSDPQAPQCILGFDMTERYDGSNDGLCAIDVELQTTGEISYRLYRDPGFDENPGFLAVWEHMRSLTKTASSVLRAVHFRINVDSSKVHEYGALLCALRDLKKSLPGTSAWAPCCSLGGFGYPLVSTQNLHTEVEKRWGQRIVPFDAQNHFYDSDHYLTGHSLWDDSRI